MKTIEFLKDKNVDIDTAVKNMVDIDTYNELLDDYYNELLNNISNLNQYRQSNDMSNYAILVHSMKSNARSFGFLKLGDICYNHEIASKAGDTAYVNNNFDELKTMVDEVYNIITEYRN